MKKFLSLMLAMIMVMSLVTVGAGAAFSDAEEIQYKEAVQVMADLGILAGYDDGSFKPQGNLSRGAAAKIIAYIALGTTTAESLSISDMKFTDVPTTSSRAPFIAWAAEQGIVDGYGDGTFNPNGNVSGHAFLKMVLGAMGVDGVFTGTSWRVNVTSAAEDNDLFEGIDTDVVVLSEDCTRELACQIAFNAMFKDLEAKTAYKVGVMEFDSASEAALYASLTNSEVTAIKREAGSMAERNFKLATAEGMVISNAAVESDQDYAEKTKLDNGTYYKFASGLSLIGHNVTVYYNSKTNAVVSVYDNSTTLSVSTSKNTIADVNAALDEDNEEDDPITFSVPYWNTTYTKSTISDSTVFGVAEDKKSGDDYAETYALSSYNLIITDGEVTAVTKSLTKYLAQVVEIEADEDNDGEGAYITLTDGDSELELENNTDTDAVVEYAGIEEDDYVVYTKAGEVYTLTKATTVTGKITKINGTKVTLGGKTYSKTGTDKTGSSLDDKFAAADVNFTDEYTLYLSGTSYLAITKASASTDVVFFVAGYQLTDSSSSYGVEDEDPTYWAQCVDLNGNEVKYQLAAPADMEQGLYKVSTAYNKTVKATVASFAATGTSTAVATDEDALKIVANHYYTDDVKFISVDGTLSNLDVTVKKGAQNVDADVMKYYVASGDGTNKTVSYVFVAGEFGDGGKNVTGDIVYAIEDGLDLIGDYTVISVPYVDEDGNDQVGYEHTVYIDGVETTIITDSADALGGFIELDEIVDGVYSTAVYGDDTEEAANLIHSGVVTNVYNGMITVEEWDNEAAADEDITLVDVDASEAEIIDLRLELEIIEKEKDLISKVSKLEGRTVALVLDDTTFDVVMIYIIG